MPSFCSSPLQETRIFTPRGTAGGYLNYNNQGLIKRNFYVTEELELCKWKETELYIYSILQAKTAWNNTVLAETQNTLGKFKSSLKNSTKKDKIFFFPSPSGFKLKFIVPWQGISSIHLVNHKMKNSLFLFLVKKVTHTCRQGSECLHGWVALQHFYYYYFFFLEKGRDKIKISFIFCLVEGKYCCVHSSLSPWLIMLPSSRMSPLLGHYRRDVLRAPKSKSLHPQYCQGNLRNHRIIWVGWDH